MLGGKKGVQMRLTGIQLFFWYLLFSIIDFRREAEPVIILLQENQKLSHHFTLLLRNKLNCSLYKAIVALKLAVLHYK